MKCNGMPVIIINYHQPLTEESGGHIYGTIEGGILIMISSAI